MLFSLASTLIISSILLFSVGRLRLAIYSIRRLLYSSECRRPENILPLEMWTSILENLDDNDLRAAATACRLFNEIGFTLFFVKNNSCSTESIPSGALSIQSPFTRPGGLQRAIFFHTIRRLSFTFTGSTILRDLEVLRRVLPYASGVTHLELSFPESLLDPRHAIDDASRKSILIVLHSVLFRCAVQVDNRLGPVVFVAGSVGFFPASKIARRERESGIRSRLQKWIVGLGLTSILTLKVIPLPPSSSHGLGRMILINDKTTTCLEFINDRTHDAVYPTAPGVNLVLPHNTLPCLKELRVRTPKIDPTILSDFLGRHTLEKLYYEPGHVPLPSVFVTPPVDLPSLKILSTASCPVSWLSGYQSVPAIPLINGVILSPLCRIEIRFTHENLDVIDSWKAALRRISKLDAETRLTVVLTPVSLMHCEFQVVQGGLAGLQVDEEEQSILKTLRNVTDVEVQPVHFSDASQLLPRLAMLPALTRVTFRQPINQQYPSVTAFKSEVAAHVSSGVVVDVKPSEYRDA